MHIHRVVMALIYGLGGIFSIIKPYNRPFSLVDLSISYPDIEGVITTEILLLVCGLTPALIIAVAVLTLVPGRDARQTLNRSQLLRLKLWEFNAGWMGYGLSHAIAFFVTQGMKNSVGKPRPNLIARCRPDLTDVGAHTITSLGASMSESWVYVDSGICTTENRGKLEDAYRSFPSGHSSFAWSGMLFLSLWLCHKFAIVTPATPIAAPEKIQSTSSSGQSQSSLDVEQEKHPSKPLKCPTQIPSQHYRAAAPPMYLIVVPFVPLAISVWICSTRYSEFYHSGIDVIAGTLIGIMSA
jgi:membrane-associated phospholipid phosphatase